MGGATTTTVVAPAPDQTTTHPTKEAEVTLTEAMNVCECCGELGARRWRGTVMCEECIESVIGDINS